VRRSREVYEESRDHLRRGEHERPVHHAEEYKRNYWDESDRHQDRPLEMIEESERDLHRPLPSTHSRASPYEDNMFDVPDHFQTRVASHRVKEETPDYW
jgi:hypothetical protein